VRAACAASRRRLAMARTDPPPGLSVREVWSIGLPPPPYARAATGSSRPLGFSFLPFIPWADGSNKIPRASLGSRGASIRFREPDQVHVSGRAGR